MNLLAHKDESKKRILVVDDRPQNLRLLAKLLTSEDYAVQVARDGAVALRAVATDPPDLILLDVDMPGMSGFEVCAELQTSPETADIPVIFVSALSEVTAKVEGLEAGGVDYVTKPFQFPEILARVRTHLELSHLRQSLRTNMVVLEEKNVRLDMFAKTLAHDLRNPLTTVMSCSELMNLVELPREEALPMVASIHQASGVIRDIIESLLLLATSDREDIDLVPTDVGEAGNVCLEELKTLIDSNEAEVEIEENMPLCRAHAPWVRRVLTNYMSNAIKYGGHPPKVRLFAETVDEETVRYVVADNGPGLAKEDQERLFQEFERLDPERAEGLGLGLTLAKHVVSHMAGKVGVRSQEGEGAQFFFEVPRDQPELSSEIDE